LIVFGAVVFVLFRGWSPGPSEAATGGGVPDSNTVSNPDQSTPAPAQTQPQPQPVPSTSIAGQLPAGPASPAAVPAAQAQPNPGVAAIQAEAAALLKSQPGRLIQVRDKLNGTLKMPMSAEQLQAIREQLSKAADAWLFGPAVFAGDTLCEGYTVKSGDLLQVIGRRHKVPHEILMQINEIPRPESLQAGRTIKVINGPFHAKVYRSTFTLDLYLQDTFVRSFKVGLGAPGTETPTGLWRVKEGGKLIQPPWYDKKTNRTYRPTDPDYPLGSRWIALEGMEGEAKGQIGYAIHGTKEPGQIGTAASQGCIRMYNGEAILTYNVLFPVYSRVEILP
jgi:LysM repeat protein